VSPFRPFLPSQPGVYSRAAFLLTTNYPPPTTPLSCSAVHESQITNHKSRLFMGLPPLCRSQKSQLLCNQANPDSFTKMPGCGGGHPDPVFGLSAGVDEDSRCRRRNHGTPGVGCAERICGTPGRGQFQDASLVSASPFRINTCKSISKQTTFPSFRINTYEKQGEGVQQ